MQAATCGERNLYSRFNPRYSWKCRRSSIRRIKKLKCLGNSVGGTISCTISGLDAGYGGPLFEGLEGRIAEIVYAIPAVKGIEFGAGFESTRMYGSEKQTMNSTTMSVARCAHEQITVAAY